MKQIPIILLASLCIGCAKEKPTLKVAATAVPHAEILEEIKPDLKSHGIDLDIIIVEDYNTPNRALEQKEVDANYFQHAPFLEAQVHDFGYQLENYASVHLEPMGLYSKKLKSLDHLPKGLTIAIPSDPTNQARALLLLEQKRILTLKKHDATATIHDINADPYGAKWIEVDSPLLARSLDDADLAAITTNFALQAGLSPQKDALALEAPTSLFVNILVIRQGEGNRADLQTLKQALTSEKVQNFIQSHYKDAVIFKDDTHDHSQ